MKACKSDGFLRLSGQSQQDTPVARHASCLRRRAHASAVPDARWSALAMPVARRGVRARFWCRSRAAGWSRSREPRLCVDRCAQLELLVELRCTELLVHKSHLPSVLAIPNSNTPKKLSPKTRITNARPGPHASTQHGPIPILCVHGWWLHGAWQTLRSD